MRQMVLPLLAAGSLVFSACTGRTSATTDSTAAGTTAAGAFDENAARTQIIAADSAFVRGLTSKHVDSLMNYYDPGVVSMSEGTKAVKGLADVRASYDEMVKSNPRQFTFATEGVNFSNDHSMAWDYGKFTAVVDGPNGKPLKVAGHGLNVWKHVGDRWLIVAEISNSSP